MMATITFTLAEDELRGTRAAVVANMINMIVEAAGDPVTWDELIDGIEHPHQYTPALHALEMVGAIQRFDYIRPGKSKKSHAYCLADGVEVEA